MADTPTPRSYSQTLGDMFDAFLSNQGIRSLRVGSPIVSILEAAAQSDLRNAQDIFNLLTSADLDNATGLALMRIGRQERVPKLEITPATGTVTISDSSFTKISTKLFQGAPAPIVGSTTIHVVDATLWPTPGPDTKIYIGRGTSNYEGPIRYTAKVNVGNHWEITLFTATTKFHNTSETVIVAQGGNRVVGPNSVVRTPQANTSSAVEFRTRFPANLPDGETEVANIEVVAKLSGNVGNVIAGAISEFAQDPFDGAVVTNPAPFTNGHETESDNDYRERIRNIRASRQLGTTLAITTAVTGITAVDENKRINSASLVKRFGYPATLYVDDGTGYEERTAPVAIESLMDDAVGGEDHFQTTQRPIARAYAITTNDAPFVLRSTDKLAVKVGGVTYTHSFNEADFHSISNASAYEVVASINSNPDIAFVARTAEHGSKVVVFANRDVNEDIEVIVNDSGTDANDGLAFPAGINYTMRLYKNDRLLVKDGRVAALAGLPFAQWDAMAGDQTLILEIDGTPELQFTFSDQDFIDAQTGYATLGRNSLAAWAAVINAEVPGITCSENAGRLILTSNAGPVEKASVVVKGGTLVSAHLFDQSSATGAPRDYVLDRNEAQISLSQILEAGDTLTAGSFATRAFLESEPLALIDLGADAKMWFIVDGNAEIIEHGLNSSTNLLSYVDRSRDYGNLFTIEAASAVFANVEPEDWMVIWDTGVDSSLLGVHRVVEATGLKVVVERHEAMQTRRSGHASVALQSPGGTTIGKILTCGGGVQAHSAVAQNTTPQTILNTVEIYDPNTKTVTPVASMVRPRSFHTATVIPNGKVVVIGGQWDQQLYHNSIEIYDPTTDSWSLSNKSLTQSRRNHTATLLTDGRILIAGGDAGGTTVRNTYQIYDPIANTLTTQASMIGTRSRHCAVKLPDDTVLIAGGYDNTLTDLLTSELFTPGPDTVAATSTDMETARSGFGMEAVGDPVTAVIAAGNHYGASGTGSYELWDVATGQWQGETIFGFSIAYEDKPLVRITNGNVVGLNGYSPTTELGFMIDGSYTVTSIAPNTATNDTGLGTRWYTQLVELKSGDGTTTKNIVASIGGSWQHSGAWDFQPTAIFTTYDTATTNWDSPDPAVNSSFFLNDAGIAFVRSNGFVQEVTIPSGTNYTASALVDILNEELESASASTYKTTRIRVNTNRYANGGDIALVTQNVEAEELLFEPGDAIENIASHVGSVETGSSGLGTPWFDDLFVISQSKGAGGAHPKVCIPTLTPPTPDYSLVGLRNWWRGALSGSYFASSWIEPRANSNYKFDSRLKTTTHTLFTRDSTVEYRDAPPQPWGGLDRVYFAAPFAISPNGNLEVEVDNNVANHFSINMWRTLSPVGNVYADTNTFKDGDGGDVSLAETFGLDYDFNDFAVYMASRAVAFSGDSTLAMLFRYFRLGPDGDNVRVLFGNADAPDQPLTVKTVLGDEGQTTVTVKLKSGALRTPTVHDSTKVGYAVTSQSGGLQSTLTWVMNLAISSASRTSNVVTATVSLPTGVTDHGLPALANIWVESTDVNFSSGLKQIISVTATTVTYAETAADIGATANIGSLSYDSQGEATLTGGSVVTGDFFRIEDPDGLVSLGNLTFQVSALPAGGRSFDVTSGDQIRGDSFGITTTLIWQPIVEADNFTIFANTGDTMTQVAADINALRAEDGSTCPISATAIGDGSGIINTNTPDFFGTATGWYTLTDGINWVKTTTSPVNVLGDYDLEFKVPTTASLASDADWENEVVRLVPITTKNIVDWLNTPTVAGLFTQADIEASDGGNRVQITSLTAGSAGGIEVQGGLANSVTAAVVGGAKQNTGWWWNQIARLDGEGLHTNMWARIDNEDRLPNLNTLYNGLTLNSWGQDGLMSFDFPIVDVQFSEVECKLAFEKQGDYVAVSVIGADGIVNFGGFAGGYWLRLSEDSGATIAQTSTANLGLFRILRVGASNLSEGGGTLYIENSSAIEEISECKVSVYGPNSVMPGSQLVILSDVWGADNIGTWDVLQVGTTTATSGDPFANATSFVVDVSSRVPNFPGASALDPTTATEVFVRESSPMSWIMKIHGISLNPDDGEFLDIRWDKPISASMISGAAGSVITVLDKLDFPTTFAAGSDGYRYDTGLLREANKVVYGDPANPAQYPGVAAADAHINIQGPLVKRIQVGLSIRVKSGLNTQDIANRVRSAVATVVNKTAIGQSIAFSDIIDAARDVVGVVSVTIVSPLYSVAHDQIEIQPYEKPYVLDLTQDVQVSFLGT